MNYQIQEQKLKEILLQAYEAGWHGVKELKEQYVEEIVDGLQNCLMEHQNNLPQCATSASAHNDVTLNWVDHSPVQIFVSGSTLSY